MIGRGLGVFVFVSVTGPDGLIIQAVLNLHFPHRAACLMVNPDEYCILTTSPGTSERDERERVKCSVTESHQQRETQK